MRHSMFLVALFMLGLFINTASAQKKPVTKGKILKEKQAEKKPDFRASTVKEAKFGKEPRPIADTYIIVFNEEQFQSFARKNAKTKYKTREAQGKAANAHERDMIKKIRQVANKDLGITPAMIKEYYTSAFVGIKVQVKNARSKGLDKKFRAAKSKLATVFQDFEVGVSTTTEATPVDLAVAGQTTSWGTNFVGSANYTGYYWAWVIDTGIDLDHPDLNVVTSSTFAKSFTGTSTANDDNGHGTHCAGIIAAKNNTIGTKGVAAGARVVPVKVLGSNGRGSWSNIAKGIDHVAKYAWSGDVANLSLGGGAPTTPEWLSWWDDRWDVEDAVRNLAGKGVYVTIAAGNDNAHANNYTPARVNGTRIYTISNMTYYQRIAASSNYGNGPVDYAAPGTSIISTYRNGGYAYLSGTSMAAPYVAGILLSNNGVIRTRGRLLVDKDSNKDRIAVK